MARSRASHASRRSSKSWRRFEGLFERMQGRGLGTDAVFQLSDCLRRTTRRGAAYSVLLGRLRGAASQKYVRGGICHRTTIRYYVIRAGKLTEASHCGLTFVDLVADYDTEMNIMSRDYSLPGVYMGGRMILALRTRMTPNTRMQIASVHGIKD